MKSERVRIVLCGMRGVGTLPTLRAFLNAGFEVQALVMPGPPGLATLPPLTQAKTSVPLARRNPDADPIDDVARSAGIPVLLVGQLRHPEVIAAISVYQPDLLVASCFPLKVPPELLRVPRLGCLNVHPSLLPIGRGAEPVFWTLRRGEAMTGVTVHLMDEEYDAGPILLQESIPIPFGIRLPDFERDLSEICGALLVTAVDQMVTGAATPMPQDHEQATTAPIPSDDDFAIPTDRSAAWAYSFARAVAPLRGPLTVVDTGTGERMPVRDALSWELSSLAGHPFSQESGSVTVQFRDGTVRFRTASDHMSEIDDSESP